MGDVLSQAEVENLLSSLDGDPTPAAPAQQAAASPAAPVYSSVPAPPPRTREKVTPYDFKRPERVGKDQMRALQTMHEGFGRNYGAALSALLRTIVEVKLTSVDQLTYSEFIFSLENPTCFNLINAAPLEGQLILDINPSLLFPIIDRLLGGGSEATPPARRPLTEIELLLVGRITGLFLNEMRSAWENVIELDLSVDRVESNPQLVQIVPPNEVVVLISFELTIGDVRGMVNLCIPFNSIERIGQELSANSWVTYSSKPASPEAIQRLGLQVQSAAVEVVVELAETTISTADFIGLRVGDIIATEKDVRQPLCMLIEGRRKFEASAGAFKGRKAIQVSGVITDPAQRTAKQADEDAA
ncbi:Flagellar motor switch protein FliM [Posidoniimonas polymericola]|uniref:Flagellar motor switch protein FliM n=1 Tax=Posidoniimonas polymericola TaxID=2528002 RepID=A0A5C5YHT0_9BACT|nr:flagellar motor switch protein FliM [Posidoniimonas polymericola]TWT74541.1 Flagellar motor switch protein FliM [Posidoniimonas polymericola]